MSGVEITPSNRSSRSRSRSRTRNSTANTRSTSATRRPSSSSTRKSLSSSSLNKLTITSTQINNETIIPSVNVILDNSLPAEFFKQDIIALTKTLKISKWYKKQLDLKILKVNRISGALTNSIYKVEYNDPKNEIYLPSLLLRVYGKNVDELIDRDHELLTLIKLSQKRIGPRLLGIFINGRFEQFLDGFVTLNKEQIRDSIISQMFGRRMKDLHYKIQLDEEDLKSVPTCWRLIEKWLKIFEFEYLPNYISSGINPEDIFFMKFDELKNLIFKYKNWLFLKYDEKNFTSNYKFCHNDTQYGNLLLCESFKPEDIIVDSPPTTKVDDIIIKSTSNKKDNNLVVIDFEYSGPNFPAFDIVNHFSEWMTNYHDPIKSYYLDESKYPTRLEQLNLLKSYIEYDFQLPSSNLKTSKNPVEFLIGESGNNHEDTLNLIQYEIEKMYNECIYWRGSVQIFWCFWGLIQNGPIKPKLQKSESEKGIDSTYNITIDVEKLNINGKENDDHSKDDDDDSDIVLEEAITSSDDDFDYLKYSNQKISLFLGDAIQFNLIKIEEILPKYRDFIKYLNTDLLNSSL
ncbi:uncharacterized protein KGF55_000423 [Candida pseudojiufengensis]|uniref:uncharacterized protein n=1 Tax=Candida pseudojiufengensis TaxID=497109 RepID=UPI00222576BA|nr:uncharacterized protein KGF55_000423 [Candida pseudojiufengensis]KAI5967013.1 hypothetical protein KGF55_000423 [Candida pseudojiufengensis]